MDGNSTSIRLWQRLRSDFQLAIVSLFGASAALIIMPFALWRFASSQLLLGAVDTAIVACISGAVVYAWRSGNVAWPAVFVAVAATVGCMAVVYLQPLGQLWLFPTLLATYFLVPRHWATVLSLLVLVTLAVFDQVFESPLHKITFLASGAMLTLFSFIFATRTEAQHRMLRALASQDSLTGADNRRAMEEELERVVAPHRRAAVPLSLAIMDLDHFKRINDGAGHEAGDRVLQAFADLLRDNTRRGDHFFRFGGEEFVVLLPGADAGALQVIGDKLRESIAAGLHHAGAPVTVSIGAAELRTGETWQDWLARADAALYRAKQGGRNRVVVADAYASDKNDLGRHPRESADAATSRA
jgi:diguanylate cyclase (GGDEF)-like protein